VSFVFRFQTITRLVYEHFLPEKLRRHPAFQVHWKTCLKQLTQNYRSTKGVLDLAASVVDVMYAFFPDKVDKLEREVSLADSKALPVVIYGELTIVCLYMSSIGSNVFPLFRQEP
jgi:hypothetical protein